MLGVDRLFLSGAVVQGASFDTIEAKRNENPEVRKAAREQAVRCVRDSSAVADACMHE